MQTVSAHPITSIVLIGSSCLVPFLAFATYKASGASTRSSLGIAAAIALWGGLVYMFARHWQFGIASPVGVWAVVIANLLWPSILVASVPRLFVGEGVSLPWLTAIQATRYMGGLFILENVRGLTGTEFAYIGGFGDVIAAAIATTILLQLVTGGRPNKFIYYFLIVFGTVDFVVAYSLSFLSTAGVPAQRFALDESHLMGLYPLAMLPFFLVPFAMASHTLMFLTVRRTPGGKL